MVQKLVVTKDQNSIPIYGTPYPDTALNFKTVLAIGVEQTLLVPPNVNIAIMAYTSLGVWSDESSIPLTLPGGAFVAGGERGQLDASVREVTPGATLRFITNVLNVEVNVTFWAAQNSTFGLIP